VTVVRSLGSGSSGNALLVESEDCLIAVDCGIGARELVSGLRAAGRTLAELDAVLLTHEHTDHIRALPPVIAGKVPVLATAGTARAARLPMAAWEPVRAGAPVSIKWLEVTPLAVSHDAAEPCGYFVRCGACAIAVFTDLGSPHESLHPYLAASDLVVLEANHDEHLLRRGPYPAHLKRRVLSDVGHLSNVDCGSLLAAALPLDGRTRTVWLAHLSTTNNRPELARTTVRHALAAHGVDAEVVSLPRYRQDVVWTPAMASRRPVQLGLELGAL
jgi:phosphoribosyl 1,2-cyclic phosphodiesterase